MAVPCLPIGRRRSPHAARRRSLLKRLVRDESGFSLIELLVVSAMLPIVLIAILLTLDSVTAQTPTNVEYTHAIDEAQQGLQQMVQDIAQGVKFGGENPGEIDFNTVTGQSVEYQCNIAYPGSNPYGYYRCLRLWAPVGTSIPSLVGNACPGTLSAGQGCEVAIDRILNGNSVFTYTFPNSDPAAEPTYVEAAIKVPGRGERSVGFNHSVTLDNGTAIRNALF